MKSTALHEQPQKINELESIRGLAAFLVVLCHMPKWNPLGDVGIINNGYLMVDLFFVLSGYVISGAYGGRITSRNALLRFQFLRFGRLYPVHILFLFVFVLIEFAKYKAQIKYGITSPNSVPFQFNDLAAFAKNIFLIQAVLPDQPPTFNVPAWSISVEFYTYLLFGLVVLFFEELKTYFFVALAVISLLMLATNHTFGFENVLRCFSGFFVGCLAAIATSKRRFPLPNYLSAIVMMALIFFLQSKTSKYFDISIFFFAALLILSIVLSPEGLLNKLLNFQFFIWLGSISYSVYMSHAVIEWIANQFIRVILKRPEVLGIDGGSTPQLSLAEALIAYTVTVLLVLLVGAIVFRFVERPMRERSRRLALSTFFH